MSDDQSIMEDPRAVETTHTIQRIQCALRNATESSSREIGQADQLSIAGRLKSLSDRFIGEQAYGQFLTDIAPFARNIEPRSMLGQRLKKIAGLGCKSKNPWKIMGHIHAAFFVNEEKIEPDRHFASTLALCFSGCTTQFLSGYDINEDALDEALDWAFDMETLKLTDRASKRAVSDSFKKLSKRFQALQAKQATLPAKPKPSHNHSAIKTSLD